MLAKIIKQTIKDIKDATRAKIIGNQSKKQRNLLKSKIQVYNFEVTISEN